MTKKFFRQLALVIIISITMNPTKILASTANTPEDISLYASNSTTIELKHNEAGTVKTVNMGFNPTVTVKARGNANMVFKVWVVNPVGITGDVGYVRGDGSTISKNLLLSVGGDYFVHVQPWSGTTNGKSAYFDLTITW